MSQTVDVSVVVPCYRAASLARRSADALLDYLPQVASTWEILVVDDGGGDFADDQWEGDPRLRLVKLPLNRGKGAAVRTGLMAARGDVRIFTDVDLPFGFDAFPAMVELLSRRRLHLVVGDRTLPGSSYGLQLSLGRRVASALFSQFVGTMVTGGYFDTQCGLKGLRGDVAEALCPHLRVDRFAFDVELLYVALKHRLDVRAIPVQLKHNETSSVRLLKDAIRGVWDVARIKRRQLAGGYVIPALAKIVQADYEALTRDARMHAAEIRDQTPWA